MVVDGAITVAHVGDSRAYRLRGERLEQLTDDHSLVATMVRDGIMDPADAATDGRRNIITRALGAEDQVRVDLVTSDLAPGDRLLLCSDGLHGQVDDATIATVLRDEPDPAVAVDRLIALANAAGGEDNVTVIVIHPDMLAGSADRVGTADDRDGEADITEAVAIAATTARRPEDATAPRRRRSRRPLVVFLLLVLAAIALAFVGWQVAASISPA
jgi:protein phosphatase